MKHAFALVLTTLALALGGCATASKPEAMTVSEANLQRRHAATVELHVTGGQETHAAGASQISAADIESALAESIRQTQVFKNVSTPGDYRLEVYVARLSQPKFGFSMTVTLDINWSLIRRSDDTTIWKRGITTTYTAKAGEAFAGVKRLRLANEGAARENIQEALAAISKLDLP